MCNHGVLSSIRMTIWVYMAQQTATDEMTETIEPRAVAVTLQKGGVGKSLISTNLCERLASRGHDVLFVDLDPNGHGSAAVGLKDAYDDDIYLGDYVLPSGSATISDVVYSTEFGFDVIPSNDELQALQDQLKSVEFSYTMVKRKVTDELLGDHYDYVVYDTSGDKTLLAGSAIIAAGNVILPLTANDEVYTALEKTVYNQIKRIQKNMSVDILAIVPNDFKGMDSNEPELIKELNNTEGMAEHLPPFAQTDMLETSPGPGIRHRVAFSRAAGQGQPLAAYDPDNDQLERFDQLAAIVEQGGIDG